MGIVALGEDAALHRALEAEGLVFLQGVEVVEAPEEEEIRDLLDDFEGIGDAAGSEGVSEGGDFTAEFTGEHGGVAKVRVVTEGPAKPGRHVIAAAWFIMRLDGVAQESGSS